MMQRIWVVIVGVLLLGAALHGQGLARWALATGGAAMIGSGFSPPALASEPPGR